jgi:hypothetical protein
MKRWEYFVARLGLYYPGTNEVLASGDEDPDDKHELGKALSLYGRLGWELIEVVNLNQRPWMLFFFRREVAETSS